MTRLRLPRAPARRLAAVRVLVAGYATVWLLVRFPYLMAVADLPARRFEPVGVLSPLSAPLPAAVVAALGVVAVAASAAVTVGWRHRLTGPLAAGAVLAVATYVSSWGQIFHTENLLVLHLLVVGFAPATAAWSLDARRRGTGRAAGRDPSPAGTAYGWPLAVMAGVTVITYTLAGIAKLDVGGTAWLSGEALRSQVAFDNLRKLLLGDVHSPLGGWLAGVDWVWPAVAAPSVAIELAAPLALLGRRARLLWAAAAWALHVAILLLMAIVFAYPLTGIAFAPLFEIERPVEVILARRGLRREQTRGAVRFG